ncbi:MAG TPA: extracellular solute-binding protein [Candidatus Limnocylindria bacterium]|jgi:arabinogalactan oligomer/maltooligosaccharide transport system substrate-binding protein|nr:extracellular solute-binding protein [Candidatus Limnocylindria bacterium]
MNLRSIAVLFVALIVAAACGGGGTTGGGVAAGSIKGNITLWHAYHTGGSEEQALTQLIDKIKKDNPDAKITVLAIPFDQIFNKFQTESASGGGPDLFTAPNDELGTEVRAKLLLALDDKLKGKLDKVAPLGVDGLKVDGKLYGIPMLFKAVALYYNKDKVANAPKTTDELMNLVKGGKSIVQNQNGYHMFGWSQAFGGNLMDANGKCVADQGGWADALQYNLDLKKAGAKFETDGGRADTSFRQGQVDMIINGPWVLGDYKKDLGAKLGVAPIPAGPKGKAGPLTGVDGWYINSSAKNVDGAIALALALTDAAGQKVYADVAGDVPVRTDVTVSDPLVKAFSEASATGFARPQSSEFGNYWGPFGDAVTKIMEGKATPQAGIAEACAAMNKANKK